MNSIVNGIINNPKTTAAGATTAAGCAALAYKAYADHNLGAAAAFGVMAIGLLLKGVFAKDA